MDATGLCKQDRPACLDSISYWLDQPLRRSRYSPPCFWSESNVLAFATLAAVSGCLHFLIYHQPSTLLTTNFCLTFSAIVFVSLSSACLLCGRVQGSKLSTSIRYCSPAWSGCCSAPDRPRLGGFLEWCKRPGFCDKELASIIEIFDDTDSIFSLLTSNLKSVNMFCGHAYLTVFILPYQLRQRLHDIKQSVWMTVTL